MLLLHESNRVNAAWLGGASYKKSWSYYCLLKLRKGPSIFYFSLLLIRVKGNYRREKKNKTKENKSCQKKEYENGESWTQVDFVWFLCQTSIARGFVETTSKGDGQQKSKSFLSSLFYWTRFDLFLLVKATKGQ